MASDVGFWGIRTRLTKSTDHPSRVLTPTPWAGLPVPEEGQLARLLACSFSVSFFLLFLSLTLCLCACLCACLCLCLRLSVVLSLSLSLSLSVRLSRLLTNPGGGCVGPVACTSSSGVGSYSLSCLCTTVYRSRVPPPLRRNSQQNAVFPMELHQIAALPAKPRKLRNTKAPNGCKKGRIMATTGVAS